MTDAISSVLRVLPVEALVVLLVGALGGIAYFYRESRLWERRYWTSKVKGQEKLRDVTERAMRIADKIEGKP